MRVRVVNKMEKKTGWLSANDERPRVRDVRGVRGRGRCFGLRSVRKTRARARQRQHEVVLVWRGRVLVLGCLPNSHLLPQLLRDLEPLLMQVREGVGGCVRVSVCVEATVGWSARVCTASSET